MNRFTNWYLKCILPKREKLKDIFNHSFSENEKKAIANSALTTASQIMMTAIVMTNSENYITGDCVFPDGSKWVLTFKKETQSDEQ